MKETLSLSYRATAELDPDRPAQRQRVANVALNLGSQKVPEGASLSIVQWESLRPEKLKCGVAFHAYLNGSSGTRKRTSNQNSTHRRAFFDVVAHCLG
jgi:hypothetical protein